ncbi:MAG: V-type ATPase subunit [Defluviitaleaceae bacterium]|nr:V-type ATPase subunit [Defluviitaleaceae bacterium]
MRKNPDFSCISPYLYEKNVRDFVKIFITNLENGLWAQTLWPRLSSLDKREPMRRVLGTEIDLRNILWMYRLKFFHQVDGDAVYAFLAPIRYRLTREETAVLAHINKQENFAAAVAAGVYGNVFKSLLHLQRGETEITHAVQSRFKKESQNSGLAAVCGKIYERYCDTNT